MYRQLFLGGLGDEASKVGLKRPAASAVPGTPYSPPGTRLAAPMPSIPFASDRSDDCKGNG